MIPSPGSVIRFNFPVARLARTVVAGLPHHVTSRGNRREAIFFEDGDQEVYRDLLAEQTRGRSRGVGVPSHSRRGGTEAGQTDITIALMIILS